MRVLQAMDGADCGGAEKFFVRLCVALHRRGVPQEIVLGTNPDLTQQLETAGLVVHQSFAKGTQRFMRADFLRIIADYKPDLVVTWMSPATFLCPRSTGLSGVQTFVHAARLGGYYNLVHYSNCDYLIGNTPDLIRYFQEGGWHEDQTIFLPNFTTGPSAGSKPLPREVHSTPIDVPLILALGRFHENKAFDVLIDALARLPTAHLWIAGDEGPTKPVLLEQVNNRGLGQRVRFLPWQWDVSPLLLAADLLVCSSRIEPFGNVILEGWSHKVPVVATAAQGPTQIVENGVDGILVPIDDPNQLADAIGRVIGDGNLQERLQNAGYHKYLRHYSEELCANAYIDFFNRICAAKEISQA